MNESKIKLALGILSGRIDAERLNADEYELLGFTDRYQPDPRSHEVKEAAEQIILEALLNRGSDKRVAMIERNLATFLSLAIGTSRLVAFCAFIWFLLQVQWQAAIVAFLVFVLLAIDVKVSD